MIRMPKLSATKAAISFASNTVSNWVQELETERERTAATREAQLHARIAQTNTDILKDVIELNKTNRLTSDEVLALELAGVNVPDECKPIPQVK